MAGQVKFQNVQNVKTGILIITRELELSDTKAISQSVFEKWEIQSRKKMPGNLS